MVVFRWEFAPDTRRLRDILAVPVGCFVVAGAMAPAYSDQDLDWGQFAWSLVIWWPIGGALLLARAALLLETRRRWTLIAGELAIALAGVFSIVLVYRTDDAQAGLGLIYAPILGCAMVGALRGIEWVSGSSAQRQFGARANMGVSWRSEPSTAGQVTRAPPE